MGKRHAAGLVMGVKEVLIFYLATEERTKMSDGRCPRCFRYLETTDARCPYCAPAIVGNRTYTFPEMLKEFFPNEDYQHDSLCLSCRKTFNRIEGHVCNRYSGK